MKTVNDIENLKKVLPHGHGFLLIDKIVDFESQKYITAVKNITYNEPCFSSHFPHQSVFPGMFILEAGFQAAMMLWYKSFFESSIKDPDLHNVFAFASKVKNAAFKQKVVPGDVLTIKIEHIARKLDFYFARASFLVEDGREQPEVANSLFSGYYRFE